MEVTVICTYTLRAGSRADFLALLHQHWATLDRAGLVGPAPSRLLAGADDGASDRIVEIFEWKSRESAGEAHHLPEVLAIWEPMADLCEAMDFRHFTPI